MVKILDGKKKADEKITGLRKIASKLSMDAVDVPTLAVVSVGDDEASKVYMRSKKSDCEKCGFNIKEAHFNDSLSENNLIDYIRYLGNDPSVNGIIITTPLPDKYNESRVMGAIPLEKDIDCLNPTSIGLLNMGEATFGPCTPSGIIDLLNQYEINLESKNCVVIGRSNTVGKPLATMLTKLNANVEICHSYTKNLVEHTKRADILIVAAGKPGIVDASMVKPGVIAVDVGINRDPETNKIVGDISKDVYEVAEYITPVPGGIGPMTRATLMSHLLIAYINQHGEQV